MPWYLERICQFQRPLQGIPLVSRGVAQRRHVQKSAPPARPATCHMAGCVFVSFSAPARLQMTLVGVRDAICHLKHPYDVPMCPSSTQSRCATIVGVKKKSKEPKLEGLLKTIALQDSFLYCERPVAGSNHLESGERT